MTVKYNGVAQDLQGAALPSATVTVKNALTGANAPIFNDDGSSKTNPLTTDSSGRFSFNAEAGLYTIEITKGLYSATLTNITLIEDPSILYLVNDNGSALALGNLVYISGDGEVKKGQSDGTEAEASVMAACAESTLANGATGRFRALGLIARTGTPGVIGYLSDTGTITETVPSSGFATVVGKQISNTLFDININLPVEIA